MFPVSHERKDALLPWTFLFYDNVADICAHPRSRDILCTAKYFWLMTDIGRQDIFYMNCVYVLMLGINWCKRENDIT